MPRPGPVALRGSLILALTGLILSAWALPLAIHGQPLDAPLGPSPEAHRVPASEADAPAAAAADASQRPEVVPTAGVITQESAAGPEGSGPKSETEGGETASVEPRELPELGKPVSDGKVTDVPPEESMTTPNPAPEVVAPRAAGGRADGTLSAARAEPRGSVFHLRPDAGDDQVGVVGRQITLSAARSEPRGRVGFRWIQTGGPKVALKVEDGAFLTFLPTEEGTYRFAVVVAEDRSISEPDEVDVQVVPSAPAGRAEAAPPAGRAAFPASAESAARGALASIPGGTAAGPALAEAFGAVADRMDLYQSFADVFQEMSRRLDAIVPQEPRARGAWVDRVFSPLTARLVERLLAEGLDLRRPEDQGRGLSAPQRKALAETLRAMARGFAAGAPQS